MAYHLLLEFLGEIGVALYEILYDAVHLYGKFPLLALFLFGKPYAALLAQELHGFGIVVAALLAVLECPRQRLFIGLVVVYALLHAAEYLHLIDGFDAQAEVFLHELLVYDGAAYAHAHGAYLQIALAAHGGSRNGRPAEAQQLFLYVLRYLGDLIRVLYLMAVYTEGWKPLLGVGGEYGGEVYGAGALCAVKAPYALYRHGIHIHGLGAVAPAGRDGEGYGYAFSAELFGAGGGFRHAADGGIGYDHLYMVAVGVVKVILEELFHSLRHGHYLALKALAQLHGASAAVDNGTDAYDRIAAYVTILCHIFFLLENCTLRHCRGHEFGSRGRIYLITHNAINMYFLYYQLGLEHGHAGRDCASVQPFY